MRMKSVLQLLASLALCVVPALARPALHLIVIRQPATIFTIRTGMVISVRALDLPFVGKRCIIEYRSDNGELIELWNPDPNLLLINGMHGMLTYSTHPERVLQFRVLAFTPKEMPFQPHGTSSGHRMRPLK